MDRRDSAEGSGGEHVRDANLGAVVVAVGHVESRGQNLPGAAILDEAGPGTDELAEDRVQEERLAGAERRLHCEQARAVAALESG